MFVDAPAESTRWTAPATSISGKQGDEAIVRAALEMAVEYHVYQLGDRRDHFRLERSSVRIGNRSRSLLVIGGYAVMKYTEPYNTKDLDLWTDQRLKMLPASMTLLPVSALL